MINAIGIPLRMKNDIPGERNDALMKAAYLYGVRVYYYSISDIPAFLKGEKLPALYWDGGEYRSCHIDLPQYTEIYCGFQPPADVSTEYQWIKEHTKSTDDYGLGKYRLQLLLQSSDLMEYSIPSILIRNYEDLQRNITGLVSAILKPFGGRKAMGLMKLTCKEHDIFYATPERTGKLTKEVFDQFYGSLGFENYTLLLEPCLNILNDDGRAVDFRCIVSLNGEGKWQNVMTYARIGGSNVASNFSHGGSLNFAKDVLEEMAPGHGKEKLQEINEVALKVAAFVQKHSPNPVSWLGLDICMDRPSNQIYVIEANSKPGTKLVGPWPLALVRAQYFKYILENGLE